MSEKSSEPLLTRLTTAHLPEAVALSTEMAWPYRLEDWAFAHALGNGFALELENKLIGTAMGWNYGDEFSSVGMIIVAKAFQGRGYGARLVDALLANLQSRTVLLNATQEAVNLYQRRGFVKTGELNQHQGVPLLQRRENQHPGLKVADVSDLPSIIRLDREASGMQRVELLNSLAEVGRLSLVVEGGVVSGYAVCRAFGRGYVIGPVVAENTDVARALIEDNIVRLPGSFVRVDTASESGLSPWLSAVGLKHVGSETSMTRGTPPRVSGPTRIFALCSQSLG